MNYTVPQMADILGMSHKHVRGICKKLGFEMFGNSWIITPKGAYEIQKWILDHPRGRPRTRIELVQNPDGNK